MKKVITLVLVSVLALTVILVNYNEAYAIPVIGQYDYSVRDYLVLTSNNTMIVDDYGSSDFVAGGKMINPTVVDPTSIVYSYQFNITSNPTYLNVIRNMYFNDSISGDIFDGDFDVHYMSIAGNQLSYDLGSTNFFYQDNLISNIFPNDFNRTELDLSGLWTTATYTSSFYLTIIVSAPNTQLESDVTTYINETFLRGFYLSNRYAENILTSAFVSNDYDDGYSQGFDDASDFYIPLQQTYYDNGYNAGRNFYGLFYNDQWYNAVQWGNLRFNEGDGVGYLRGLSASSSEAYNKGFTDGANGNFMSDLGDWIVPAIILVLIVGGFIGYSKLKNGRE